MKAMNLKPILWLGIISVFFAACNTELEEEISWNLDDSPDLLVVEANLTNEEKHQEILLTLTGPYFDTTRPRSVLGAVVTVSDGETTFEFSPGSSEAGLYISDSIFACEPLKNYSLYIELQEPVYGLTEYTAVSTMPEGIDIDTIVCEVYNLPDFDNLPGEAGEEIDSTLLGVYYYGKEPDNPENYYLVRLSGNNEPWQKTIKDVLRFPDDYNNGALSNLILYVKNVGEGDTISFTLQSVEKEYYDFIGSIQQMDQAGNAYNMSGPPANAVGNISNALGYFNTTYVSGATGIAVFREK